MKKSILALVAVMVILLAGGVGAGYAYWAGSITAPTLAEDDLTITIGVGQSVATKITVSNETGAGTLVPAGRAITGQVESVTYTFDIEWDEDTTSNFAADNAGTLTAVYLADSVKINGSTANANLVHITIQVGEIQDDENGDPGEFGDNATSAIALDGSAVTVYVKVTLSEPGTQAIYNAVAGKAITFDVEFSVTVD